MRKRSQRPLLETALARGAGASLLSAAVLAICSKLEGRGFAAGLNGPSQWLWGEHAAYSRKPSVKHTVIGYVIHHASATLWATLHAKLAGSSQDKSRGRILAEAAAVTAAAYLVDYKLTPRRLRPGFEKHLSPLSMTAVYAGFSLGLAAITQWQRRR